MMQDAWGQYVEYAWGNNELKPVSKTGQTGDIFGNAQIGATIVDSLDTLYIMEMMDEYEKARDFVANELNFDVVWDKLYLEYIKCIDILICFN
jgi:mannosyl-oligosaccharide alpha-1,2-mannosidase